METGISQSISRKALIAADMLDGVLQGIPSLIKSNCGYGITEHHVYELAYAEELTSSLCEEVGDDVLYQTIPYLSATLKDNTEGAFLLFKRREIVPVNYLGDTLVNGFDTLHNFEGSCRDPSSRIHASFTKMAQPKYTLDISTVLKKYLKSRFYSFLFIALAICFIWNQGVTSLINGLLTEPYTAISSVGATAPSFSLIPSEEVRSEVAEVEDSADDNTESIMDSLVVSPDAVVLPEHITALVGLVTKLILFMLIILFCLLLLSIALDMVYILLPASRSLFTDWHSAFANEALANSEHSFIPNREELRSKIEYIQDIGAQMDLDDILKLKFEKVLRRGIRSADDFRVLARIEVLGDLSNSFI